MGHFTVQCAGIALAAVMPGSCTRAGSVPCCGKTVVGVTVDIGVMPGMRGGVVFRHQAPD